ncbi:unnamed protein product [Clonostachys solani]|uniref:Uncharacterized protein n=1 Tax=Clonostachys solani TaxID=160281 RepID=A0A9N9ZFK7_9HYPO|nr:unnamed protein product [Clonostachys solani]
MSPSTPSDLKEHVFATIRPTMQESEICEAHCVARRLNWCLPLPADRAIWIQILEQPLATSPEQLGEIVNLERVPLTRSQRPTGHISFYIRTFSFKAFELRKVIDNISINGHDKCHILQAWARLLQTIDPTASLHATLLLYPDVVRDAIVQEICHGGVINTEAGGRFLHEPSLNDERYFKLLSTRVVQQIGNQELTHLISSNKQLQIEALAKEIQAYANTHQYETGTSKYPFLKPQLDSLVRNLEFSTLRNGWTPFLTLGAEITQSAFRNHDSKSFFLGSSKSAHLATTTYDHFGSWETTPADDKTTITSRMVACNHLPFINLFNWPKTDDATINDALQFLKRYFELTQPVVVMTYGHLLSFAALEVFDPMISIKNDSFELLDHVGNLYMRKFPNESENDPIAFIVLPYSIQAGLLTTGG